MPPRLEALRKQRLVGPEGMGEVDQAKGKTVDVMKKKILIQKGAHIGLVEILSPKPMSNPSLWEHARKGVTVHAIGNHLLNSLWTIQSHSLKERTTIPL